MRSESRQNRFALLLVVTGAFATCGHGDEGGGCGCGGHDEPQEEEQFICDGIEDAYDVGLIREGDGGVFKLEVLDFTPNPHQINDSSMLVRLLDANDTPVANAEFTRVEPLAAKHDHGTPITPMVTAQATDGEYAIDDIAYVHRGPWNLTIDVQTVDAADTIGFLFCIVDPAFP